MLSFWYHNLDNIINYLIQINMHMIHIKEVQIEYRLFLVNFYLLHENI